jgi:hypothetical protein
MRSRLPSRSRASTFRVLLLLIAATSLLGVTLTLVGAGGGDGVGGLARLRAARRWAQGLSLSRGNVTARLWRLLSRSAAAGGGDVNASVAAAELAALLDGAAATSGSAGDDGDGGDDDGAAAEEAADDVSAAVPDDVLDDEAAPALPLSADLLAAAVAPSSADDELLDDASGNASDAVGAAAFQEEAAEDSAAAPADADGAAGDADDEDDEDDEEGEDESDGGEQEQGAGDEATGGVDGAATDGGSDVNGTEPDTTTAAEDADAAAPGSSSGGGSVLSELVGVGGAGGASDATAAPWWASSTGWRRRAALPEALTRPLAYLHQGRWLTNASLFADGHAQCVQGLDGFTLCEYRYACWNVPRLWSHGRDGARVAAHVVRKPGTGAPSLKLPWPPVDPVVAAAAARRRRRQFPRGRPVPSPSRRRQRHAHPSTVGYDRVFTDASSRSLLDVRFRLAPVLAEGMATELREIGPMDAVSVKRGGRHDGPVRWYDSLYVAVAPPDDDPTYPPHADWRVASSLVFPLLSAAFLNVTQGLGLPRPENLLYLGGDAAALDGLSGPSLRPAWDSALLHGVARFVAGHAVNQDGDGGRRRRPRRMRGGGTTGAPTLAAPGHLFLGRDFPRAPQPAGKGGAGGKKGAAAAAAANSEGEDGGDDGPDADDGSGNATTAAAAGGADSRPAAGGRASRKAPTIPPHALRFMVVGEDAVHTKRLGEKPARVCARRAVWLGHKPMLTGGAAEANALRLALQSHIFPRHGSVKYVYPSVAERKPPPGADRGAPALRLLVWDAARVANLDDVVAVARKYAGAAGGGLAHVTTLTAEEADALPPGRLVGLFASAHILVSPGGEGFVHALLLPPRSAVILVHGYQAWGGPLQQRIATLAGHHVLPVFSRLKGPGVSYGSTGTLTPDECEALPYVGVASSPCAGAYRRAKVVVPLASFEAALLDAMALAGPARVPHAGSPLDYLEGAPHAGMPPQPPFYDPGYADAISRAFCDGGCAPLPADGGGIVPSAGSAERDGGGELTRPAG